MARNDDDKPPKLAGWSRVRRTVGAVTAIAVTVVAVGGFYLVLSSARGGQTPAVVTPSASTPTPAPPTSVMLSLSAPGTPPTTQGDMTFAPNTIVTLTVMPDHSLVPFQEFAMGIYAHDPYPFSELQYCTYPSTDICSYVVSYSSAEKTDYTKGKHVFTAFLGNAGGAILQRSNDITITWAQ